VHRLRRWLFERGDNLAGAIYGTILVMSIIASADFHENLWRSFALVVVTSAVFWLAHVYAHALALSLDERETFSRVEIRRVAGREWPLLQAAVVPSLVLLAGALGLFGTMTTYRLAVGYGAAALVWWGFAFARKERLSGKSTAVVVVVNAAFGIFIVLLKELVSH
jgi:hypothetical protein